MILILPPSMPCVLPPPLKFQRRRKSVHATVADESGQRDAHQDYAVENWVDEAPAGNYRRRYDRLTGYSIHRNLAMSAGRVVTVEELSIIALLIRRSQPEQPDVLDQAG
jgi:hypothetical protein